MARYEPAPDADLADPDADDPLAALRRDIGGARGQVLAVESQMSAADSPASAPRKDFQVARFGANPPQGLIELREKVTLDIGAAVGVPRALLDARASGKRRAKRGGSLSRRRLTAWRGGSKRSCYAQLGVVVAFDSAPLGGRDLLARAAAFARLAKGGVDMGDARRAAGI